MDSVENFTRSKHFAPLHSAEIASREFPRARRGFDPDAVREWLRAAARTVEALEEENLRLREERDRTLAAFRRVRDSSAAAVRASLAQARLKRRPGGYDRHDVEKMLESATSELARLESRETLLRTQIELMEKERDSAGDLASVVADLQRELETLRRRVDGPATTLTAV